MEPSSQTDHSVIADVLDRAAAHIETVGWLQGDLYDTVQAVDTPLAKCAVCAMGAINVVLHGNPYFPNEGLDAHDLAEYVQRRFDGYDLAAWNDLPGRTQADVTTALRETATELRGGNR